MKIWLRFSLYFSVGLLLFTLYLLILFPILLALFLPHLGWEQVYVVNSSGSPDDWIVVFIFLFSLFSGGVLFSIFFVSPVFQLISFLPNLSSGEKIVNNRKIFRADGKPKALYFLFGDIIADIQKLEERLHQAEQERQKIEAAKKDWLAGVSHDLKTPLSYITGYSSLLLHPDYEFTSEETRTYLDQIYQKSVYIEKMVEDLNLSFYLESDSLQLRLEETDLVYLLQEVVNDVAASPQSPKDRISFLSKEKRTFVNVDARLIYRALHNLIMNGVEHNSPQTQIMISLERNERHQLVIQISDNGQGMSSEIIKNCFEKYTNSEKRHTIEDW